MTEFSSYLFSLVFGRTRAGCSFLIQESLPKATGCRQTFGFLLDCPTHKRWDGHLGELAEPACHLFHEAD